jgi:hypothetical protein
MFQNLSELCPPPPQGWTGDSDLYLCRLPEDLRSQKRSIPEDSNPNGGGNPVQVTFRLISACSKGCTDRMLQSGHHTTAEWMILKMLLCEGVTAEERTGPRHFFNI